MAAYQDKVLVHDAITENTKLDLSHVHITSANFQQLSPVYNKEMVPGETLKCGMETFARMNPLVVPTFGRANVKNSAYFVPFRTIFRGWTDFVTDAPHANSMNNSELVGNILNTVPTVSNDVLMRAIMPNRAIGLDEPVSGANFTPASMRGPEYMIFGSSYNASQVTNDGIYDFVAQVDSATTYNFKLSFVGRQIMKVLESLGYKINFNYADTTKFSALPLLAFAKVYIDWYFPQDYTNTDIYNYLYMLCNADTGVPLELTHVDVGRILQFVYTCYDSDYFVSAWDHPNTPNTGTYSDTFRIENIDTARVIGFAGTAGNMANQTTSSAYKGVVSLGGGVSSYINGGLYNSGSNSNDAPFIAPFTVRSASTEKATVTPISEYLLHGLHALTDYMKRHQLAGSAAFQRYLSRFGKALSSEKMNRSIYLGTDTTPLQIGDIMSTSNVSSTGFDGLGEYAGKGLVYGQTKDFEFSTDEYGMFIVVSSIQPAVGYFQGLDRNVKHITRLDFWTPEFDCLGVQPITADELYVSQDGTTDFGSSSIHSQTFGFTPRYAEYKKANDQITGLLRYKSLNGELSGVTANFLGSSSWHLMRTFSDEDFGGAVSGMVHSVDFCYAKNDYGQFNRIFPNASYTAPDQFNMIYNFNVVSYSPMKSLYDTYEFEDKGKQVTLQANGVAKN